MSDTAKREEEILVFWRKNRIFEKSVEKSAPHGEYIFYDGPPFATGLPHYGHIVASVIKDAVPRYWTMRGYRVPRVWGWDCHGLPIENIVEKELGFKHKKDIKNYGVEKFNELCRQRVLTFAHEWEKIIPRIGRWVDMGHAYRTMDKPFMESVWWVFKQLWEKELIYEDYRVMHICPRCETTLSQQEVSEGYKEVKDIAVTVKFKVKNPEKIGLSGDVYLLAWTTTPWTLPGNVALAVGKDIQYVAFKQDDLAHDGKDFVLQETGNTLIASKEFYSVGGTGPIAVGKTVYKGTDLIGLEYVPPFDYYVNDMTIKSRENGWKVYAADFVTADEGTGIAHEAPAFGADDWALLKKYDLPFVQHVNFDGTFKLEVKDFAGMEVKPLGEDNVRLAADIAILKYLQEHGLLFRKENITHSYPHCWRCDTPLLNYATSSWFVNIFKIKDGMLENAKAITWSPEHIKEGRWGKWLEGARDWSISRQRFWASVIPLWVCEKCKAQRVFGSAAELEKASGQKIEDLHKHLIDKVTVPCGCGGRMMRIPDVLDTWFDSGSMPYGQRHYPFEHKEAFDQSFPARFIAEGLDQTRAWFYYMHVLSTALFSKEAFKNVIVNGIVLAEDGKKMSKKLQNYPDPMEIVEKYGADALRMYLLSSPVVQAENLAFSEKGVDEMAKKNIGRLGNVLAFYQLYADGTARGTASAHVLDRWILARLDELIRDVTKGFDEYTLDAATRPLGDFIDDLSVWYLRRSRERFKEESADKAAALATMRHVLFIFAGVMAPSAPFFAECLFQAVKENGDAESVHLEMWPAPKRTWKDMMGFVPISRSTPKAISLEMERTRRLVSIALEERDKAGIKIRQPLSRLTIPEDANISEEFIALVLDEVNVKKIEKKGTTVVLDTELTDELREEGIVRNTIRLVQGARKAAKMKPGERGSISIQVAEGERGVVEKNLSAISKQTNTDVTLS